MAVGILILELMAGRCNFPTVGISSRAFTAQEVCLCKHLAMYALLMPESRSPVKLKGVIMVRLVVFWIYIGVPLFRGTAILASKL